MASNNCYVYVYYDENDKPVYIGKGTGDRLMDRVRYVNRGKLGTHFRNWLAKYIDGYGCIPTIKKIVEGITSSEALAVERNLIHQYGRRDINTGILLNHTSGGDGGTGRIVSDSERRWRIEFSKTLWTEERKKAWSESLKGHVTSDETKQKISDALIGRPLSEETKRKIGESQIGRDSPMLGKTHSMESKLKISEQSKRIWQDPKYRSNQLEKVQGAENPNAKRYWVTTNDIDVITDCLKIFCTEQNLVYGSVTGKFSKLQTNIITHKGYTFERIDE